MDRIKFFSLMIVCLMTFFGCRKNLETDFNPTLNAANDIILAQRPFINAFNILVKAVLDTGLQNNYSALIDSASVTLTPDKKIYTFSYYGEHCPDSVTRAGSFRAVLDTSFFVPGVTVKIIFTGFLEDGHYIKGNDSLRFDGPGQGGKLVYRNFITGAEISKDTVRIIKYEGDLIFFADPEIISQGIKNAVIMIEGSGEGTSSMGYIYNTSVTSSIRDSLACPWFKDGIINIFLPDGECKNGSIEFMAKTGCNNRINYNFNGTEYHIWQSDKYLAD